MTTILEYIDIYKSFGPKVIYKGLDLKIQKGETFFVLLGVQAQENLFDKNVGWFATS